MKNRTELILSELKVACGKIPSGARAQKRTNRRLIQGRLVSDGEVKQLLRHYSSLVEHWEQMKKRAVLRQQKTFRDTERALLIEEERNHFA